MNSKIGDRLVYFIRASESGRVKIGHANDVRRRLIELQNGSPELLAILGVLPGGPELEANLHERFAAARLRGEWFAPVPELLEFLRSLPPYRRPPDGRKNNPGRPRGRKYPVCVHFYLKPSELAEIDAAIPETQSRSDWLRNVLAEAAEQDLAARGGASRPDLD